MSKSGAWAEARRWLRFAEEDLQAAQAMLAGETAAPRHACWLAQQAAEKALKAVLISHGIDFPWRHDLDALRNLLPEGLKMRDEHPDLAALTEWAVEARYPGEWPEATEADACAAVEQAAAVVESAQGDVPNDPPDDPQSQDAAETEA